MAPFVMIDSKLWVDGFDMSGYKNRITVDGPLALKEHTRFGDKATRRAAGLRSTALKSSGFWDTAGTAFEPDKPYFDRIGVVDVPVSCAPQDGNEGSIGFLFRAGVARYQPGAAVGEMLAFEVNADGSDGVGLVRATIIANKSLAAGAGQLGTAFQIGALSATQKLYAALHVLAVTTSIDVVLQRDTVGFPSPLTALTFAQRTTPGSEYLTLAGPQTDDYYRVSVTVVGGAPNARFVVVVGIR